MGKVNKLKTLKDIYDTSKMSYISDEASEVVDDLRDAAREWINLFQKDLAKQIEDMTNYCCSNSKEELYDWCKRDIKDLRHENAIFKIYGKIELLKHFFNLEDEK